MKTKKIIPIMFMVLFLVLGSSATAGEEVAETMIGSGGIHWTPKVNYGKISLSVSSPNGDVIHKIFVGSSPYFDLSFFDGLPLLDGTYTYELRALPSVTLKERKNNQERGIPQNAPTQTGYFTVQGGTIVTNMADETPSRPMDQVILDDLIVDGSLCVGFDCINGESFGFDTLRLKENNLRIHFYDTSTSASFPTTDWRITINDSASGGASYFGIDDADSGRSVFKIEAGTRANALYVDDSGRVGLGTSTPSEDLHIWYGDTPTIRLAQSGSGWAPQTWDIAGNEANFFIRDVTNGSKLPFRIQPNTPGDSLCLKSDGKIGIGTWSPEASLEVETTGSPARIWVDRTDGARGELIAKNTSVAFGSASNHPVQVITNDTNVMYLDEDGDLGIGPFNPTTEPDQKLKMWDGAYCDGTTWHTGSSRAFKENIQTLGSEEALATLEELEPVKFNYKVHKDDQSVGFIAEDVPELVATKGRKSLVSMDIVAVLTKVVKEQQKVMKEQQETIKKLEKRIEKIENK